MAEHSSVHTLCSLHGGLLAGFAGFSLHDGRAKNESPLASEEEAIAVNSESGGNVMYVGGRSY